MTIGERIREIRRDQNISQTQLAQAAGLNQPQVSAIEGGRVKPSAKTIERIATALHVPVESITNEQPKSDPTFTPYQVMLIDAGEIEKCVHEWYDVGEYVFADTIRNADTIIEAEVNGE